MHIGFVLLPMDVDFGTAGLCGASFPMALAQSCRRSLTLVAHQAPRQLLLWFLLLC